MASESMDGEATTMSESPIEASIAPWLTVTDGAKAVEYYKSTLGATEGYRLDGDGGRIAVAQLHVGSATFWLQEDVDGSPGAGDACPIRIILTVDDPDPFFDRAIARGAKQVASVHTEHGWRTGRVTDPFGHDWEFSKPVTP
jgi:PhnB protein